MQIRLIENVSTQDKLKIQDFLIKFTSALNILEKEESLHLESFLDAPLLFKVAPPNFLFQIPQLPSFVRYEKGVAYFQVGEEDEHLLLSFDWNQLYSELSEGASSRLIEKVLASPAPANLWQKGGGKKHLSLSSIGSGREILSAMAHATWEYMQSQPTPQAKVPRFVVFLPMAFYPYLVEPAQTGENENVRAELASRLGVRVVLSSELVREGVLLYESALAPSRPLTPLYFLGVDEEGQRKLFVYLDEPKGCREIPYLVLALRESRFRKWVRKLSRRMVKVFFWLLTIPLVWEIYRLIRPHLVPYAKKVLEVLRTWL